MRKQGCLLFAVCATVLVILWTIRLGRRQDEENYQGYRKCQKKNKVAFLKTHKCASSTVQNILMRYGLRNNLNFVLPSAGNYLGRYRKYSRAMLSDTLWDQAHLPYHLFCLHTIWNREEVHLTLGEGATYFTMIRDPVDLFESLWVYAGMESFYGVDLESFAISPKTGKLANRAWKNLGRNQMLWDFGLSSQLMDDPTAVDQKIREIEDTFHLVLLSDRLDESMILLKDLLCWDYRDLVNFKLNARKADTKAELSQLARQELEKFLAADYKLFNHFKAIFQKKVDSFGNRRMEQEVAILRKANNNMKEKCALIPVDNELLQGETKLWGPGMLGYKANNSADPECRLLALSEMSFIDLLREKQKERAYKVLGSDYVESHHHLNPEAVNFQVLSGQPMDIKKLKSLLVHSKK